MILRFVCTILFWIVACAPAVYAQDTVYDRVMKSQTIRCGYGLWSVYLHKDPNTGKMGGIYYDYMEALGKNLGLKIEWTEEVGWGDYIAGLKGDRFDAYCTLVALNAQRAREVDFIAPIFYAPSNIFVAEGDVRFDKDISLINKPDITVTTVEGDIYSKITAIEFPAARKFELPQLACEAELFMTLADHKADALVTETSSGIAYMKANPGKIRQIPMNEPYRGLPVSISIKGGEFRFQRMLEIASTEMQATGVIYNILKKNDPDATAHILIRKPFQTQK